MRILHIDDQRGWRGGEQQAAYLIRGLERLGHTNVIAGCPGCPFLLRGGSDATVRVAAPFLGEGDMYTAWVIARAVRKHRVDILHAHSSHAHTMAILARHMARRGKVVVSRRVDFPPKANAFNRWKYRQPDRLVAISHHIGAILLHFGIGHDQLRVVRSAIDPSRLEVPALDRQTLGIASDAPLLGNVAALVGHKDQATLLAAMPKVLHALPNLHLVIAGEGELRGRLEAQMDALNLKKNVRLLGYRDDVPALLRALDAFVLSSKMEGLGTSVLDAMACGLPVVATSGGGIPEMVIDGVTGLLAPPENPEALADAIVRLFQDTALARRLGEEARRHVHREFTVDRMVEGNVRVYEEVLRG